VSGQLDHDDRADHVDDEQQVQSQVHAEEDAPDATILLQQHQTGHRVGRDRQEHQVGQDNEEQRQDEPAETEPVKIVGGEDPDHFREREEVQQEERDGERLLQHDARGHPGHQSRAKGEPPAEYLCHSRSTRHCLDPSRRVAPTSLRSGGSTASSARPCGI